MADRIAFELVSPERLLLSDRYEMVVVPGGDGDFAVMPGHVPIMSTLRPGVIEIFEADRSIDRIFVNGGFAEVSNDRLVVLAEEAIATADLDRAQVEQWVQNAREDIEDAKDDEQLRKSQDRFDHLQHLLEALT
jgi:F-type H+-transporting ATPase subunit epsilon